MTGLLPPSDHARRVEGSVCPPVPSFVTLCHWKIFICSRFVAPSFKVIDSVLKLPVSSRDVPHTFLIQLATGNSLVEVRYEPVLNTNIIIHS